MRRRPPLHQVGRDPDYRFTLANERTFLAWVRTALALSAGGLAAIELLPRLVVPGAREAIGTGLVGLGTLVALTSFRRWEANERAMRTGDALPRSRIPLVLAIGASVVSVVALVLLVATGLGA